MGIGTACHGGDPTTDSFTRLPLFNQVEFSQENANLFLIAISAKKKS
jgi:hypothetical protein